MTRSPRACALLLLVVLAGCASSGPAPATSSSTPTTPALSPVRIARILALPDCTTAQSMFEEDGTPWVTFRVLGSPGLAPIPEYAVTIFEQFVADRLPRRRSLHTTVVSCAASGDAAVVVSASTHEILDALLPKLDAPFRPDFRVSYDMVYTLPMDIAQRDATALRDARDAADALARGASGRDFDLLTAERGVDAPLAGRGNVQEDILRNNVPPDLQQLFAASLAPGQVLGPVELRLTETSRIEALSIVKFLSQADDRITYDELTIPVRGPVWDGVPIGFDPSWVDGIEMVPHADDTNEMTVTLRLSSVGLTTLQAAYADAKTKLTDFAEPTIVLVFDPASAGGMGSLSNDGYRIDTEALQAATIDHPLVPLHLSYTTPSDGSDVRANAAAFTASLSGLKLERVASST